MSLSPLNQGDVASGHLTSCSLPHLSGLRGGVCPSSMSTWPGDGEPRPTDPTCHFGNSSYATIHSQVWFQPGQP